MSYASIRAALRDRTDSLSPALDTVYEGEAYEPTDGTPWQKADLLPGLPTNAGVGSSSPTLEVGIWQITLFYPAAQVEQMQARAEIVRTHFDRATSGITSGSVHVRINTKPAVSQVLKDDALGDGWRYLVVSVAYFAHV